LKGVASGWAAVVCACVLVLAGSAGATGAGDLDPSFGAGGVTRTVIGNGGSGLARLALQSDGKIIGVGQADYATGKTGFAVTRYLDNGTLDPSFGSGGVVETAFGTLNDEAFATAVQPDGRIIAAGFSMIDPSADVNGFAVARYLTNGNLDPSFGTGGRFAQSVSEAAGQEYANAVALQADGKIVLAGYGAADASGGAFEIVLVRLKSDGTLDPSFGGGDGIVQTPVRPGGSEAQDVIVQPDGKLLVAVNEGVNAAIVARYMSDGTLDAGFGSAGFASYPFATGSGTYAERVALAPGGKILVGATGLSSGQGLDFRVARFNSDGTVDSSAFGGAGGASYAPAASGANTELTQLLVQSDGDMILAGWAGAQGSRTFQIVRLTPSGVLDPTFSCDGIADSPLSPASANTDWHMSAAAIDSAGRLVAGGFTIDRTTPGGDFVVARYLLNGTPDCAGSGGGGGGGGGGGPLDLGVAVTSDTAQIAPGGQETFRIKVTDISGQPANNLHVVITLPAGAIVNLAQTDRGSGCGTDATPGELNCDLNYLSNDSPLGNITLVLTLPNAGSATLTASATASQTEASLANNTASASVQVGATPTPPPPPPPPVKPAGTHVINGNSGANTITGTTGADLIHAGSGNDKVNGGAGNDTIYGGPGNDILFGGPGRDTIFGGPGNDMIHAVDGTKDTIDCGSGHDVVYADEIDKVAKNCEVIHRKQSTFQAPQPAVQLPTARWNESKLVVRLRGGSLVGFG
jgi:uncharacterized delta-60 repeat protein